VRSPDVVKFGRNYCPQNERAAGILAEVVAGVRVSGTGRNSLITRSLRDRGLVVLTATSARNGPTFGYLNATPGGACVMTPTIRNPWPERPRPCGQSGYVSRNLVAGAATPCGQSGHTHRADSGPACGRIGHTSKYPPGWWGWGSLFAAPRAIVRVGTQGRRQTLRHPARINAAAGSAANHHC
jgi:hypothetical protein